MLYFAQVDMKSSGKTALQVASHQGHLDIVKLLLAAGSNLELQDEDGDTALHYSAFGWALSFLKLYMQGGMERQLRYVAAKIHVAYDRQVYV